MNNSTRTSYKKTVFLKPRSPPKSQGGYDRAAHNALLKEFSFLEPANGSAVISNDNKSEDSIFETVLSLINSLLHSNSLKPSHVALISERLNKINHDSNYGVNNNSMELPKYIT